MCSLTHGSALYPRDAMAVRDVRGQVAVEWLMVAGILTAVAIIIVGLIQPVLVEMVISLVNSVRMVGV